MNRKAVIGIVVLGVVALAATVGLFAAGGFSGGEEDGAGKKGKLPREISDLEASYLQIQERWRQNEERFRKKENFAELAKLNEETGKLVVKATTLKYASDEDKNRVAPLVRSIEAFNKVLPTFVMFSVNEGLVQPKNWEDAKREANLANAAWREWENASRDYTRDTTPVPE